ncbi:MAG: GNAT family N-acetyltransferase [Candidatus Bathyarchaeota archaeon]|nr:GNAT family N-acetyltransferase [Candidatus Bathyarchaeota archaeon]
MSVKDIRFRLFQLTDINAIQSLMKETISTCYATFPPAYRQHWMDDHHSVDQILSEAIEGLTLVIEHTGNIIGTGNINNTRIQSVIIHPDFQRQGYGTELMQRLEHYARNNKISVLQLSALTPSRPFFTQLRYQTISEHQFTAPNLRQFKYFIMEKRLDSTGKLEYPS